MIEAVNAEPEGELSWEEEVEKRIGNWRRALDSLADQRDEQTLHSVQTLKAAVDVQFLADLKIKSRQADWAKLMTWGGLLFPTLGALLGATLGALLKVSLDY